MKQADVYRAKAQELNARACNETDEQLQRGWAVLAQGFMRLAEQADRNSHYDVVYEPAWNMRREDQSTECPRV